MAKRTIRARLIEGLENHGYRPVPVRTGKYLALAAPCKSGVGHTVFFVGKSGGLRVASYPAGAKFTVGKAHSAPNVRARLLREVPS